MQKKLIALAVAAGVSGAAFAQSNVTIYGMIDEGYGTFSGSSGGVNPGSTGSAQRSSTSGMVMSAPSNIGFKGSEDIGGGTKVGFNAQYLLTGFGTQLTTTNGATAPTLIKGDLSVSGSWGTLVGGLLGDAHFDTVCAFDAFGCNGVASTAQIAGGVNGGNSTTSNASAGNKAGLLSGQIGGIGGAFNAPNVIAYVTPSFSGFTGIVAYTPNFYGGYNAQSSALLGQLGINAAMQNQSLPAYVLKGEYANGPLSAALSYVDAKTSNTGATSLVPNDYEIKLTTLGASYNFGAAKLFALYDDVKTTTGGYENDNVETWNLGVAVPFSSALTGKLSWATAKDTAASCTTTFSAGSCKATKWGIGLDYGFSKRTMLYADYGHITNSNNTAVGISTSAYFASANGAAAYGTNAFAVGLRHSF